MHNKVIIIDDRIVVTGSYNFSENAESNDENMLILESSRIADAYTQYFDRLFEQYQKHVLHCLPGRLFWIHVLLHPVSHVLVYQCIIFTV